MFSLNSWSSPNFSQQISWPEIAAEVVRTDTGKNMESRWRGERERKEVDITIVKHITCSKNYRKKKPRNRLKESTSVVAGYQ